MKLYVITALVLVVAVAYANAGLLGNFGKLGRFGKNSVQGRQEDKSFGFEGAVRLPYIPEYMVKVQRTMRGKTQSEKSASPAQSSAEARRYRVTERQEAEEEEAQEAEEPGSWEDENERNIFHKTNPKFRRVRRSSEEERQEEAEEEEGAAEEAAEEAAERGFLRRGKREDESLTPGFTFLIRGKRSSSKSAKKYAEHPFVAGAGAVDTESEERNEEAEEDQERKYPGGGFRSPYYDPLTEREYNNFGSGIRYRDEERTHHRQRGSAAQSRQEDWAEDAEDWAEGAEEPGEEAAEEQQEEAAEEAAEEQQEEAAEETGEAPISQQRPAASPQRRRMRRLRSRLGAASTARRRFQSPASDEDARRDFLPDLTLPFNSKHEVPLRGSFGEERRFFNPGVSAGVNQRFPLTDH